MRKTLTALVAAGLVTAAALAAPAPALARNDGALAAGIIGGIAAGAIIGGAASQGGYYAPPAYGYAPGPVYYGAGPGYGPGPECYQRQRIWDGYRWRSRRVFVC